MLPLMVMVCYSTQYATALGNAVTLHNAVCNRLWKWYVTLSMTNTKN